MGIIKTLQEHAKSNHAKVGIGVGEHTKAAQIVKKSMKSATSLDYAETVSFNSGPEMISALKDGDISAAVRGTLYAKETLG